MTPPLAEGDTVAMGVLLGQVGTVAGSDEPTDVVLVAVPAGKGIGVHLWLERSIFEGAEARAERREIEGLIAIAAGAEELAADAPALSNLQASQEADAA